MSTLEVLDLEKKEVGSVELKDSIFDVPMKSSLLHEVVNMQLAGRRAGTASTKNRSQVKSSTRKLFRQKRIGRARMGSRSSPIRVGGGTVFGPTPRSFDHRTPKRVRAKALKIALSDRRRENRLLVLDRFEIAEPKTKLMAEAIDKLELKGRVLVVLPEVDQTLRRASQNLQWVNVLSVSGLNVYDVLNHDYLVMTRDAVTRAEEVLG